MNVGGLMGLPPGAVASGMRPCWLGYVSVADVDKSVASIRAGGGSEHMAMDVPHVGRLAMVADPQGAQLYVMTPTGGHDQATSVAPGKAGHGGWHELHTTDWQSALAFYGAQFSWKKTEGMDTGPMGTDLLFNAGAGNAIGGMMNNPHAPRPFRLYYFNVADIDDAGRRIATSGGQTMMGPHQAPTGEWIIHARDPQGAMFALMGPKV